MLDFDKLTPKEIVAELDKYIIGQDKAKRTVARLSGTECAGRCFLTI